MKCPKCGAPEEHPTNPEWCVIRAYKVQDKQGDWSQCLRCSGYYNANLNPTPESHNPNKGWFVTPFFPKVIRRRRVVRERRFISSAFGFSK